MRLAAGLLAPALLTSSAAAAERTGPVAPDWAFGAPSGEAALAAISVASLASFFLPQRRSTWAADASRPVDLTYAWISDLTGATLGSFLVTGQAYAFEGGYLAREGVPEPSARALRTSLIDLEAVALSTGISWGVKRFTGRCRPRAYRDGQCSDLDADFDAFPSGHTTPVAAIAGVHLSLVARTPGDVSLRVGAFAVAEAATLVTMVLRVGAGAHSWEDVGAGWILGHVTGVALGYAHPMVDVGAPRSPGSPPPAPAMFSWSGRF